MRLPLECEAGRWGCRWLAGRRAGCRVGARWPGEVGAWPGVCRGGRRPTGRGKGRPAGVVPGQEAGARGPLCEGVCPREEIQMSKVDGWGRGAMVRRWREWRG